MGSLERSGRSHRRVWGWLGDVLEGIASAAAAAVEASIISHRGIMDGSNCFTYNALLRASYTGARNVLAR